MWKSHVHLFSLYGTLVYISIQVYCSLLISMELTITGDGINETQRVLSPQPRVQSPESSVQSPHDRSPLRVYKSPESRDESPVSCVQRRESRVRDLEMSLASMLKPRDSAVKVCILLYLFTIIFNIHI